MMMAMKMRRLLPTTGTRTWISRVSWQSVRKFASSSKGNPPFKVLGLQQVAIGSLNKSELSNLWGNILNVPKIGDYTSEKENVSEDILMLGEGSWAVELDLMEPLNPDKSPKVVVGRGKYKLATVNCNIAQVHIPALNHIGLWVDDLKVAVEHLTEKGVRFTPGGIRKGASGHDVCFIHPKGNDKYPIGGCGVLLELVQAPDDML